ncbi:Glutaminyl-tRNA synthetase [hydrothermal vent metagenome]|uniref:glutamine--tRNA ligase n=1 Tax=hydrothermal vent metagenome TaxID=652676 RepID=A0A1W1B8H4_9ZZZZ
MNKKRDFLRTIVENDLKSGKYKEIITRFPPEPNGFPHIGHAKSIALNFGIAKEFHGRCNLRMDDTNPTTEDTKYVEAIKDAVKWLGFEWDGDVRYTSDYFHKLYEYAIELIKMGKAYVDSLNEEEMREYRGTVTTPGKRSKYAQRSIEENLDLFERMKRGEFRDGEHVLRAKIDMSAANMKMRDPLLYRIRHAHHFRAGDEWAVYPMYDFAHPLSDYIEGVTHSICTLEFENNRELYDWVLDTLELKPPRPYQHEFARLNINYTVMSKRKLLELVNGGYVNGWDDPRLPTIAGYKRRGYTPESILNFCESIGVAKANSVVDVAQLEFAIRDDLNKKAPRVMCVEDPLKITIENFEGEEEIEASYYPADVAKEGSRKMPFGKEIYIDWADFEENPPKGYYRLTPTQPVRLKHAYIIKYQDAIRDENGKIVEIIAHYYPDSKSGNDTSGIKVKSAIQWVEAHHAKRVELRLYDRLFKVENPRGIEDLNPDSLKIIKDALVEPAVIEDRVSKRFQFERMGYFYADPVDYDDAHPVFNKIVSLKDSWNKKQQKQKPKEQPKQKQNPQKEGKVTPMTKEQEALFKHYTQDLKLGNEVANTIARDQALASFFEKALQCSSSVTTLANLIANEVAKELKEKSIEELFFDPSYVAELARLIDEEIISTKIAKEVFEEMAKSGKSPTEIVEERGLKQISDPEEILPIVKKVIQDNPENVKKYKDGNQKLFGFFIGQVLKATNGKANPKVVNHLVTQMLNS